MTTTHDDELEAILHKFHGRVFLDGEVPNMTYLDEAKKSINSLVQKIILADLENLEENSDCIEDQCGLDASLLVDNLLRRIRDLKSQQQENES